MNLGLLEQEFSALDALPDALYDVVITHTHGPLLTRARGILQWREKLLAGQLPEMDELCWPDETVRKTLLMRIETLQLPSFCQGQESLTDSVLKDICEGISSAEDYLAKTANKFNDKLAQRQKIQERDSSFRDEEGLADHVQSRSPAAEPEDSSPSPSTGGQSKGQRQSANLHPPKAESGPQTSAQGIETTHPTPGANSDQSKLPTGAAPGSTEPSSTAPISTKQEAQTPENTITGAQAEQASGTGEALVNHLQQQWQDIADNWQQLSEPDRQLVLDSTQQNTDSPLAAGMDEKPTGKGLPGRGWDLSTGLLTSQGWRDIIRYRQRIKALPELIHFIDAVGRKEDLIGDDKAASVDRKPQVQTPSSAQGKGERSDKTPRKVLEMDGIERGEDINRMLPSELALLCNPILKTLWHARRAERLLLLYQHQGKRGSGQKDEGALEQKGALSEAGPKGKASLGRGPIIICLDTSGSMHGEPEHIAKAAVLEVLKIAHREQRPCHLFAFSGPQQSTFHQLDLRRGGLIELLKFLQFSFHGGTDLSQALHLALEKQAEQGWGKADILLVSDGRFPLKQETIKAIEHYKKVRELRIFGILTGNWQHSGMQAFCNDTLRIHT